MSTVIVASVIATKCRNGGNARAVLNWVQGLRKLGVQVYYVEQIASQLCVDDRGETVPFAESANVAFFEHVMRDVIAFTDDDCQPEPEWLWNARRYFDDPGVVGVEGLVVSERIDDPDDRAVTNVGVEGIGFMTANLLVRRDTFNAIDGFDEQFDVPFREDTDLGWRACALGEIPFGHDVRVFHPAHARSVEREALSQRVRFFEKDALLFKKHPDRYRMLFQREGHYRNTKEFHEHFRRGALKYGVTIDEFLSQALAGGIA